MTDERLTSALEGIKLDEREERYLEWLSRMDSETAEVFAGLFEKIKNTAHSKEERQKEDIVMKERTKGLIAGVLVSTTLFGITGTALAATGAITLDVIPVKVKVNNEVFQPKDVNGNDVMVFAYNGTTYAPLRALAEAYGLEVGWDQASGTATVVDPEKVVDAPIASTGSASAEDLERWTAKKVAAPKQVALTLIKADGKRYAYADDQNLDSSYFYLTYDQGNPLVFASDILVWDEVLQFERDDSGNWVPVTGFLSKDLKAFLRQAFMTSYTIKGSENPYIDGILVPDYPNADLSGIIQFGVEEKQYISATKTHTPMWIQYGDNTVYNAPSQDGFYLQDGIRYYGGLVCCNDVLAKLGINKSFSVSEYQDLLCIEWEE